MSEPRFPGYRKASPYGGETAYRVMQDGKSTLMLPHQDGDQYIIRSYPGGRDVVTRDTGWEAAAYLRTLPVASGWEILHVRDSGSAEVARYWPMTVIDCAG